VIDTFMGLPLSNSMFSPDNKKGTDQSGYANLYFQQSFNKMLADVTSDSSSGIGGNDDNNFDLGMSPYSAGNNSLSSLIPQQNSLFSSSTVDPTIEKLYQLNTYSALIGKTIEFKVFDYNQDLKKGVAQKVVINDGAPYLLVGDEKVTLDDIVGIS